MLNKVILIGNTTRPIELRYTNNGSAIAKTGLAVNRRWNDKLSGEKKEEVMFIDITIYGKSAETANQYLTKGKKVLVEGRLVLEQWTDQTGQKRSRHSVYVENFQMLGNERSDAAAEDEYGYEHQQPSYQAQHAQPAHKEQTATPKPMPDIQINDDEIPF